MAVYDEYVKNSQPPTNGEAAQPNGTENADPAGEEPKKTEA